jgi:hypothetical protein
VRKIERIAFVKEPEKLIKRAIVKFVPKSPVNFSKVDGGEYWDTPSAGFASGDGSLFNLCLSASTKALKKGFSGIGFSINFQIGLLPSISSAKS